MFAGAVRVFPADSTQYSALRIRVLEELKRSLAQDCQMLWVVQHLGALEVDHFHCHVHIRVFLALPQHYLCIAFGYVRIWTCSATALLI